MASRGRPVIELETATAISIRASRVYKMALRELASRRKMSIADLVREACDKTYGHEIVPLVNFFELSGLFNGHSATEKSKQIVPQGKTGPDK